MPYNGVGLFTSLGTPTFPAVPNTYILASYFNATMNDVFTGLSSVMTRDGQSPMTANLPMGGNKLTGLGIGVNPADAVTFDQVFTSPAFTGIPTGPTAAPGASTTQLATTEFATLADNLLTAAIALKAPLASPALTGVPTAPTAAPGTNTDQLATMAALLAQAFIAALPAQAGKAGRFPRTDGTTATWEYPSLPATVVSGTTQTALAGNHYLMTNAALSTLSLPASPAAGDEVWVTLTNGLYTNVIARNGSTIYGDALDFTVNAGVLLTWKWKYLNNDWKTV